MAPSLEGQGIVILIIILITIIVIIAFSNNHPPRKNKLKYTRGRRTTEKESEGLEIIESPPLEDASPTTTPSCNIQLTASVSTCAIPNLTSINPQGDEFYVVYNAGNTISAQFGVIHQLTTIVMAPTAIFSQTGFTMGNEGSANPAFTLFSLVDGSTDSIRLRLFTREECLYGSRTISGITTPISSVGGGNWSPDGRLLTLSYQTTDNDFVLYVVDSTASGLPTILSKTFTGVTSAPPALFLTDSLLAVSVNDQLSLLCVSSGQTYGGGLTAAGNIISFAVNPLRQLIALNVILPEGGGNRLTIYALPQGGCGGGELIEYSSQTFSVSVGALTFSTDGLQLFSVAGTYGLVVQEGACENVAGSKLIQQSICQTTQCTIAGVPTANRLSTTDRLILVGGPVGNSNIPTLQLFSWGV